MTGLGIDADDLGLGSGLGSLQSSRILETVGGHHAVVVVGSGDHDGGIVHVFTTLDGVQRRVGIQSLKHGFVVLAGAVVAGPVPADGEEVIAKHVHHADLRNGHAKEVGTLVDDSADEQTAIGATIQCQVFRRGVAIIDKVFGAGDAVVEVDMVIMGHFHMREQRQFGGVQYLMTDNLNEGKVTPSYLVLTVGEKVRYEYEELD